MIEDVNMEALSLDMVLLNRHATEYVLAVNAYMEEGRKEEMRLRKALRNLIEETHRFGKEYPNWAPKAEESR